MAAWLGMARGKYGNMPIPVRDQTSPQTNEMMTNIKPPINDTSGEATQERYDHTITELLSQFRVNSIITIAGQTYIITRVDRDEVTRDFGVCLEPITVN